MTLEEVQEMVPNGKFQWIFGAAIYLFFCSAAFMSYNWGFFLLNPETEGGEHDIIEKLYTCTSTNQTIEQFKCSFRDDICPNP